MRQTTTSSASFDGPLAVDELLDAPTLAAFSPPDFSPDNRYLAYVVTDHTRRDPHNRRELGRAGVPWYAVASDVWIADLATGAQRNLTGGRGNCWGPRWSSDGTRLAFLGDLSDGPGLGSAGLWLWERSSEALRQVGSADLREGGEGPQWAEGGRSIV